MGNSRWRLQTTLNCVAQNVHELDREEEVEFLVADWGSDIPLRDVLELTPAAARIVLFILIPPEIARDLQKDSPFPEVLALNAAARRAGGEYIGRIDQDTLVGKRFLEHFFELYEGKQKLEVPLPSALLFANRRSIPYRFAVRCPSLWAVDRFVRWFGHSLLVENHMKHKPHLFYCSYVGIWLLHRDLWCECGGYDERLIYMNEMESDMAARLMGSKHKMINLGKLTNYDFYHLGHNLPQATYQVSANRKVNPKRWHELDEEWVPPELQPNSEDWGLIQYPLEVQHYSSNNNLPNTAERSRIVLRWPFFVFLLVTAGPQIIWDTLVLSIKATERGLIHFARVWGRRATLVWVTIRGQPLASWKNLLFELWKEKRHNRLQQQNNQHR